MGPASTLSQATGPHVTMLSEHRLPTPDGSSRPWRSPGVLGHNPRPEIAENPSRQGRPSTVQSVVIWRFSGLQMSSARTHRVAIVRVLRSVYRWHPLDWHRICICIWVHETTELSTPFENRTTAMNNPKNLAFARSFVHAVTVRPFFADLKRMRDEPTILRATPAASRPTSVAAPQPAAA